MRNNTTFEISNNGFKERVLLVLVTSKTYKINSNTRPGVKYHHVHKKNIPIDEEVEELKNLTISAGAEVQGFIVHNQEEINSRYFISSGKLEEIKAFVASKNIDLVIFNNDLSATQQGSLEDKLDVKVIDRTALILDIFAQRARSREGKLQVELAQLNYILPRLRGMGVQLSRLGGGIGTRGPGEQKLEVDRRKIRKRISQLEQKVNQISVNRETQRKRREERDNYLVSLVGYTNSGKSTILNTMTDSDVLVKDMLFSTLDSTTRKLKNAERDEILLTDTVGFIEKLPHQLVMAFKSTLEEVRKADLLLIIIDASNNNHEHHIKSVTSVLKEIGVSHKPAVCVFNKIDRITKKDLYTLNLKYKNAVFISALKGTGLDQLFSRIKHVKDRNRLQIKVKIPYSKSKLISLIHEKYEVLDKQYLNDSVVFLINADKKIYNNLSDYIFKEKEMSHKKKGRVAI